MNNALISGIFSLSGVLIGSLMSMAGILITNRLHRRKQSLRDSLDQIGAYWNLEEEMARHIAKLEGRKRAVKTIKEDFRDTIYKAKGIRPTMTELEANKLKKVI